MPRDSDTLTAEDVDTFIRKLKATLALAKRGRALETFLENLRAGLPAKERGLKLDAVAPKTPSRRGVPRRRTRQPGIEPDKVLAALKGAKEPMSIKEIAEKVGEKSKSRVAAALRKLRDDKKAKLSGQKALARWSAV